MGAVILGDEVEIRRWSRAERCDEGIFSGTANGRGGQPRVNIGIERSRSLEIFFRQVPVEIPDAVNDRGVALERHAPGQTIMKDRRDERFLFRKGSFLLNDGGQDDNLLL